MTFRIERRIWREMLLLAVLPGMVAIGAAVPAIVAQNFVTNVLVGTIPFFGAVSILNGRYLRPARRCVRLFDAGLEVLHREAVEAHVVWSEISRIRFAAGFSSRVEIYRSNQRKPLPIYLWYENTTELIQAIAVNTPQLADKSPAYQGGRIRWYAYFGLVGRMSGLLLAGALLELIVPGDRMAALVIADLALSIAVGVGFFVLLKLPFERSEVRLGSEAIEIRRFAWTTIRVPYREIKTVAIDTFVPAPGFTVRRYFPTIRIETTDNGTEMISSGICRDFVVCYYRIRELCEQASRGAARE